MTVRHFLTLDDLTPDEFRALIARAIELGEMHRAGPPWSAASWR